MDLSILRLKYFLILKRRPLALFRLMERSLTLCSQVRFVSTFTPRYLKLSVRYSLLTHNFIFKSPSIFFCLDLRQTLHFSSYKNRKLKVKLLWVRAREKIGHFLYLLFWQKGIFLSFVFYLNV